MEKLPSPFSLLSIRAKNGPKPQSSDVDLAELLDMGTGGDGSN